MELRTDDKSGASCKHNTPALETECCQNYGLRENLDVSLQIGPQNVFLSAVPRPGLRNSTELGRVSDFELGVAVCSRLLANSMTRNLQGKVFLPGRNPAHSSAALSGRVKDTSTRINRRLSHSCQIHLSQSTGSSCYLYFAAKSRLCALSVPTFATAHPNHIRNSQQLPSGKIMDNSNRGDGTVEQQQKRYGGSLTSVGKLREDEWR